MVKYAYTNPRQKRGRYRVEPSVFAVHKDETADGRYHQVLWALDGNLNKAHRRGNVRRFRLWSSAKAFAIKKGRDIGAKPVFS